MLGLLAQVLPLAIGAALTPSLFALQILTTSGNPWRARATAVALGAAFAFGVACAALLLGFAQLPTRSPGRDVNAGIVWCATGLFLTVIAAWLFWPHPRLAERVETSMRRRLSGARLITFFTLAFAFSIKDVSSFVLLVPAMHDVAVAPEPWWFKGAVALLVFAVALSPVVLPPLARLIGRARTEDAMQGMYRFTMDHQLQIGGIVAVVFAVYALIVGTGPNGLDLR